MKNSALAILTATALLGPAATHAGPGQHADVDILPGWRTPDGVHIAALRISLDEGWKTYWRAPGEAGIPPRFDWSGSENLADVGLDWPMPDIITSSGMTTLGYKGELILPIEVKATDPGADIAIEGRLAFGICEDICMPLEARVSAVLSATQSDEDPRIIKALAARPEDAGDAHVVSAECSVAPIVDGLRVSARIEMPEVGSDEYLVIEPADASIWVSEAMVRREGNILSAEADMVPPDAKPFDLDTTAVRITVLTPGRGVEIRGCTETE